MFCLQAWCPIGQKRPAIQEMTAQLTCFFRSSFNCCHTTAFSGLTPSGTSSRLTCLYKFSGTERGLSDKSATRNIASFFLKISSYKPL